MRLRSNKVYNETNVNIPRYVEDVEEDEIVYIKVSEFRNGLIHYDQRVVTKKFIFDAIRPFVDQLTVCVNFTNFEGATEIKYAAIFEMLIANGQIVPPWRS